MKTPEIRTCWIHHTGGGTARVAIEITKPLVDDYPLTFLLPSFLDGGKVFPPNRYSVSPCLRSSMRGPPIQPGRISPRTPLTFFSNHPDEPHGYAEGPSGHQHIQSQFRDQVCDFIPELRIAFSNRLTGLEGLRPPLRVSPIFTALQTG